LTLTLSQWLYLFFFGGGEFFTDLYANLTRRFIHAEVQDGGRIPEVVMVTANDINVISVAVEMFSGTPIRPIHLALRSASTFPTSVNTIMHKPEVQITQKLKQISTRSQLRATAMFWGIPSAAALEPTASDFRKQRHVQISGLGYCFYFRFVRDAVFRSRILSTLVEVDRACAKTLPRR